MERGEALLLTEADVARVIEMAWEDRTPFEAIQYQFGLNQEAGVAGAINTQCVQALAQTYMRSKKQNTVS